MSNKGGCYNEGTEDKETEDKKSVNFSRRIDTKKKQSNDDTENQLGSQEDKTSDWKKHFHV